jgi:outer membrane receptor for ferrienterochelin and colicins
MNHFFAALLLLCACATGAAQTPAAATAPPLPASAALPEAAASAPANTLDRVEITRGPTANSRRRNSTASKIVIEREDLDQYGDTALGDVLRRLPGVTLGGRPGRGGEIRMRGMGSGFTQILVDGERAPAGFAVEDLPPEQIERIEILRAPTAETGTRAIAGTINIILREPLQKSDHELRFTLGRDRNEPQADFSWTRNFKSDAVSGALSTNGAVRRRFNNIDTHNRVTNTSTGRVVEETSQLGRSTGTTTSLNGHARLRWRYSDTLNVNLAPFFAFSQNDGHSESQTEGTRFRDVLGRSDGRSHNLRLNVHANYRPRPGESWELRAGRGGFRSTGNSARNDSRISSAGVSTERQQDDRNTSEESQTSLGAKWSLKTAREHQWVSGVEAEHSQRTQFRDTRVNGVPLAGLVRFGNTLGAGNQRFAAYTQDEWSPSKQWSLYAGLRYERIETRADAAGTLPETRNISQVTSPLLHLLWKPAAFPKDQVRLSLTRSYRAPALNDLVARPTINATYPDGSNYQTYADRAGNPELKPELATGIDLSLEHWLPTGGIVSATAFVRDVQQLIRRQVMLETVSWDTAQRWVSRPRNLQGARTMGLEFEFKARLDELWEDAPDALQPLLLRFNLALYDSAVRGIPGPDNRLDQQPRGSLNVGLDHRWKALGQNFGSGFNLSVVPATRVQQTETLRREESARRQFDAYLSWSSGAVRDGINWRLSLANLVPRDGEVISSGLDPERHRLTESWSRNTTFRVLSLRADLRF